MTLLLSHKAAANLSAQPIRIIIGFLPAGKPGNKQHFPWRHRTRAENWAPAENAHALSPHSRNLTDEQLAAIRDSGGLVGVNFATALLRADVVEMPRLLSSLSSITSFAGRVVAGARLRGVGRVS
jgi:hypothetical protein